MQTNARQGNVGRRWCEGRKCGLLIVLAVLAVTVAMLAACGKPAPVPLVFNAAPWRSGEQSTYAITDSDGKPAGNATYTLSAGQGAGGDAAWLLQREVDSVGDREAITVTLDAKGFRPQTSQLRRTNGNGAESVDATYKSGQVDLTLTTRLNNMTVQRVQTPSDARETVTLPMLVRALPLASGYATQINAFLPIAGLLDRVALHVSGEEQVTVPAGAFKTWVVDLDSGDTTSKVWIGQEAPYPLVKYQDGRNKAVLELTQFTAGQ